MRESLDRSHQQPERECVHHGVAPVEAVGADPHGVVGQEAAAQRQGDKPDGNVHGEEPRPVGDRKDACGDGRACDRRHGDDRGVETQPAAQLRLGVDDADERGVDRRDGRGAEALHDARQHQRGERRGECAAHRSHREEHQPADVDLAVADQLAQRETMMASW